MKPTSTVPNAMLRHARSLLCIISLSMGYSRLTCLVEKYVLELLRLHMSVQYVDGATGLPLKR